MTGQFHRVWAKLAAIVLLLPGCLSVVNPAPEPPASERQTCKQLPAPSCHRVYVVLVNGVDPLQCGNLQGVRDYLGKLGFVKTYYAQMYHEGCLIKELREVHQEHPDARFVIIGFEYGAIPAQHLADRAAAQNMPVDLLVFLQPKGVNAPADGGPPPYRSITIRAGNDEATGEALAVPCSSRYGVPTHPTTLSTLAGELSNLAMGMPVAMPASDPFATLLEDPAPPPRPIMAEKSTTIDEWDFRKPVSRQRNRPVESVPAELPKPKRESE